MHDGPAEELNCDVIAIAATPNLAPKGLISIHKAAGKELTEAAKGKGPKRVRILHNNNISSAIIPGDSINLECSMNINCLYFNLGVRGLSETHDKPHSH